MATGKFKVSYVVHIIFLLHSSILNYQFFEDKDYITLLFSSTMSAIVSRKDIKPILPQFNSILGQNTLITPKFGYTGVNFNYERRTNCEVPSRRNNVCGTTQVVTSFSLSFYFIGQETVDTMAALTKISKCLKPNNYINFQS